MNSSIEVFVQVEEEIKELETVEKVLYSALESKVFKPFSEMKKVKKLERTN